jgi:four helix bundle protein
MIILNDLNMENKKESIVMSKAFAFSLTIIQLYKKLVYQNKEYVLSKQLLRSGTAICALIKEAEHAQSKADFLNKMNISLKEANETEYWIQLLHQSGEIDSNTADPYLTDISELIKMLVSIVKTTKTNLGR